MLTHMSQLMSCVAVCCSVLQCFRVCCSVLQERVNADACEPSHVMCCSVLQCVALCCSVLKCFAMCCSVLQCVAMCCSVLQCVAVCGSMLQCIAVCCSALVAWVRRGCTRFQTTFLLCLKDTSFPPTIGYSYSVDCPHRTFKFVPTF